ncbi:hypothetical protein IEE91_11900 [Kocuria sp. cx-455]|uniref:hypothetical protein n=1 Tax=unclassified Candidatus Sulfotelmatobacter TaxID=2635724 RepID=UPI0016856CE9|nr:MULTISPECIES: hypothetical protein [unclassified Candidatus Sulfotelmatobacter]MBD2763144.1 hypothetical protein [Kocuria sp. cx-116]MBD2765880.1 hypothetical protein [Kocuria sp. cx-455]
MEPNQRAVSPDAERGIPVVLRPFVPALLLVILGIGTLMLRVSGAINDLVLAIVFAILIIAGLLFYVLINRGAGEE